MRAPPARVFLRDLLSRACCDGHQVRGLPGKAVKPSHVTLLSPDFFFCCSPSPCNVNSEYDVRLSFESFSRVKERLLQRSHRGVRGCLQRGYQEVRPRLKFVTRSLAPETWTLRSLRTDTSQSRMSLVPASFILLDTHNYLLSMAGCIQTTTTTTKNSFKNLIC